MFKIHPEIPESLSLEAKSFILRCFEPDPNKRAITSDLLRDTFVRQNSKGKKSKIAFKPSGRVTQTSTPTLEVTLGQQTVSFCRENRHTSCRKVHCQ